MPPQQVDILIDGAIVITMDRERRVFMDGAVAISGNKIVDVGRSADLRSRYQASKTIDGKGKVVIPGLVNGHVHFYHQIHRGLAPEHLGGLCWSDFVHRNVATRLTPEDERYATLGVLAEIALTGSTTFLEAGSYNPGACLEVAGPVGLRGYMGRRTFDHVSLGHNMLVEDTETCLRENERFLKEYPNGIGLVRPCVDIVGLGRCTDELYLKSKAMADKYGVPLNLHLAAMLEEVQDCRNRTGRTPVEHLDKLGILDENVVLVHMIHVNQREIEILAKRGTKVVMCPGTALKLVYGIGQFGKFPEMIDAGVTVGLGADAGDCSNFMDMFRVMYLAAVLFKDFRFDARVMGAEKALEMATIDGAKVLGMEDEIGSLEVGKRADVVILNTNRPEWHPMHDPVQNLVYSATGDSVETVIVDGRFVCENRVLKNVNVDEVLPKLTALGDGIRERAGVKPQLSWPVIE